MKLFAYFIFFLMLLDDSNIRADEFLLQLVRINFFSDNKDTILLRNGIQINDI